MQWINVNKRLPPNNAPVLVFNGEIVSTGSTCYDEGVFIGWHIAEFDGWVSNEVTHWRPMLAPPKD